VITLDTSGLLAYISIHDAYHSSVMSTMEADRGPYYVPVAALAEMTFMLERSLPSNVEQSFIADLADGRYSLHWDEGDLVRIGELTRRYADLRLGFADAAIIACAERHGGRVLSLDRRHFDVVGRGEGTISVLPD
jgi:predicted nucleic acid-binding protein